MTLTAGEIIDAARGRHAAFDETRHPNRVVRQYLSAYARELQGKIALINPSVLRSDVTAVLPLVDHDAGIDLGDNRLVVEAVSSDADGVQYPIDVIPPEQRLDRNVRTASGWQIGTTFFLTSPATLWTRMVAVAVAVVGVPATLTAQNSVISLPDTAELVLTEKVAAFMARREARNAALDPEAIFREARSAEESYLDDVTNALSGQVFRTLDRYDP